MQKINRRGFTLIELLIFITIIALLVIFPLVICGNYWYTEAGVLQELQADHPEITKIVKTKRNIVSCSVITVEEAGKRQVYHLDTNIMTNYEFSTTE